MGRYLDGWDDAQSRGSSRNGGRGGEAHSQVLTPFIYCQSADLEIGIVKPCSAVVLTLALTTIWNHIYIYI